MRLFYLFFSFYNLLNFPPKEIFGLWKLQWQYKNHAKILSINKQVEVSGTKDVIIQGKTWDINFCKVKWQYQFINNTSSKSKKMSQDYTRISLNKVQKGYCIEEREMQRRDLRGKRWEVGLERRAAHEWMGERRNSKCGSI